jgi:hypothetical protein
MRAYLGSRYSDKVTALNVKGGEYNHHITKRQYVHAAQRLGLIQGDYLRIVPVGNNHPENIIVYDQDREIAVIL